MTRIPNTTFSDEPAKPRQPLKRRGGRRLITLLVKPGTIEVDYSILNPGDTGNPLGSTQLRQLSDQVDAIVAEYQTEIEEDVLDRLKIKIEQHVKGFLDKYDGIDGQVIDDDE